MARADDTSHHVVHHPLLASLGRDGRELERALLPVAQDLSGSRESDRPGTLLGWLQHDIAANATPDPATRTIADADRSVQVHACHGPSRQVEVLREVVLGLLADDPTLEPRDILVMCPDIEAYAPLVAAAFGMGDIGAHPGHQLRVRLADRSLTQTNPLLAVVGQLLDLAGGRAEASRVLDLLAAEPVRRRFGLSDSDLETVTGWVESAGIRWAFDAGHREPFGLESYVQNTWRFGLDRVLAGVAVSDDADRFFGTTLPLDDVGSTSIDLAGRLAECLERLRLVTDRMTGSHPVADWLAAIGDGVDQLTAVRRGDEWQAAQVHRELAAMLGASAGSGLELRLPDVRALMRERVAGRPTRANFRTGTLTVATLVPMRSVPHRVVCLLGLDDGVFPRAGAVDGDDVLARRPFTGERDVRSEDRQLMLDAVMAATEHLVVTYTGANETTGQPRPPAVPLGELLDALDGTATGGREHALRQHPLQSFDERNLDAAEPFSFDAAALAGARAAARPRVAPVGVAQTELPPQTGDVELAALMAFVKHPVKEFLRRRLDVTVVDEDDEVTDGLPVELDSLAEWGVGDRMLRDLLADRSRERALGKEWRRGVLPPGRLGWTLAQKVVDQAVPVADAAVTITAGMSLSAADVDVDLGEGRRLRGTVTDLYDHRVVKVSYSRLGPKHELDAWISLLALCASRPGRPWTAGAIGRGKGGAAARTTFGTVEGAGDLLRDLVALYDAGMRAPLPLPLKTGHTWAQFRSARSGPRTFAEKDWSKGWFPENADEAHVRVWGPGRAVVPVARAGAASGRGVRRPAHPARIPGLPALGAVDGGCPMSDPIRLTSFDLLGELPSGTTLLEASAGTGKTYAVGALVARYVAEGRARLDEMLVITFGRAASQELRERVREQLVVAERALADPEAARRDDGLVGLLAGVDDDEVAVRRARLREALADFDAATIATTHQFCQSVLRSLGVAGDSDSGAELVEDLDDLVVEVVDDVFLRRFGRLAKAPFGREVALAVARAAVGDPQAALAPTDADEGSVPHERHAFARTVRDEVERRKRRLGVLSYDDLLSRLADALEGADSPACQRMRQHWRIVLVDEFQDTDPVQWKVLDRAFTGAATMVLIGDPKQAIYAFRGGDVPTYLAAAETAETHRTLDVNRRSDEALVRALGTMLGGAALGDERIVVHPVQAHHAGSRLRTGDGSVPPPVRLRLVRSPDPQLGVDRARALIADDLADDVARLLSSGATFEGRPVGAGDVAVLIYSLRHVGLFQRALHARGIPSVVSGGSSVLLTEAGDHWLTLLEALEQPHRSARVRAVALTPFVGLTAAELDQGGDDLTDDVGERVRRWLDMLRSRGIAAVHEAVTTDGLAARVLSRPDGERLLTDLDHLGEVLHDVQHREALGLPGLLEWLRAERRAARTGNERTRRLDTDARAVQFVTIHASKGLQYPVVHLPLLFNKWTPDEPTPLFHAPDGRRTLDVGGAADDATVRLARREAAGEELRLTYVALTRAQSQVVTWWAPTRDSVTSGLSRLLFGREPGGSEMPVALPSVPPEFEAVAALTQWQDEGALVLEVAEVVGEPSLPRSAAATALGVRTFDRSVDTEWRRTSYSGLIRVEEQAAGGVGSEPELEGTVDEDAEADPTDGPAAVTPHAEVAAVVSPMDALPSGAAFGSLVHGVLEHTDPHAPDLLAELTARVEEERRWWAVEATTADLAAALVPMQHTSLGPLADGRPLGSFGLRDRLCELDFEIPLAGGEHPTAEVPLAAMAEVLRRHLAATDPMRAYADRLVSPALGGQELRGYLSGSIDVVLRVDGPNDGADDGADGQRFVVVDYKTNRLGEARPAADRRRLHPGADDRGDAALALSLAGAAVLRRRAPLPALARPGLRPRAPPRRHPLPLRPRHVRTRDPRGRRRPVRCLQLAPAGGDGGRALRAARRARAGAGGAMSELAAPVWADPFDRHRALSATGLLATFNRPDLLAAADVHVAVRMGALLEDDDEQVLLAAALAVRAVRQGSVCVDLATVADLPLEDASPLPWPEVEQWVDAVGRSRLVREEMLRLVGTRLYLDRYWREEGQVCDDLVARILRTRTQPPEVDDAALRDGLERVFPGPGFAEQRDAARAAAVSWTTVITGGPAPARPRRSPASSRWWPSSTSWRPAVLPGSRWRLRPARRPHASRRPCRSRCTPTTTPCATRPTRRGWPG